MEVEKFQILLASVSQMWSLFVFLFVRYDSELCILRWLLHWDACNIKMQTEPTNMGFKQL